MSSFTKPKGKTMHTYKEAIAKVEADLKGWDGQIKLLEAKLGSAKSDIKLKQTAAVVELRAIQRVAAEKLKELRNTSNDAWQQVKQTGDKIWDDLKVGIENVHANFK